MAEIKAKHGIHGVHVRGVYDERGEYIEAERPVHVMIYDNSGNGLTTEEVNKIAERAVTSPIYWSDDRCVHWMFDFNVWDHWCEMLTEPDEPFYECLRINVYC